mgnify:CR=1 FL=1
MNLAISLAPLVYLYTKLFVERAERKYLAYLILIQLVGNWTYFEFFFISFYFQIPVLLEVVSNKDSKGLKRWILASIAVSSLGFFSEMDSEVLVYLNAKVTDPELFITNVGVLRLLIGVLRHNSSNLHDIRSSNR